MLFTCFFVLQSSWCCSELISCRLLLSSAMCTIFLSIVLKPRRVVCSAVDRTCGVSGMDSSFYVSLGVVCVCGVVPSILDTSLHFLVYCGPISRGHSTGRATQQKFFLFELARFILLPFVFLRARERAAGAGERVRCCSVGLPYMCFVRFPVFLHFLEGMAILICLVGSPMMRMFLSDLLFLSLAFR